MYITCQHGTDGRTDGQLDAKCDSYVKAHIIERARMNGDMTNTMRGSNNPLTISNQAAATYRTGWMPANSNPSSIRPVDAAMHDCTDHIHRVMHQCVLVTDTAVRASGFRSSGRG